MKPVYNKIIVYEKVYGRVYADCQDNVSLGLRPFSERLSDNWYIPIGINMFRNESTI